MYFTPSHEWIICNDDIATIGITSYAQSELGEIVYVELPKIGSNIEKGQELAILESTKAAADVYSPVSGKIIELNTTLIDDCSKINSSPESAGWICKIQLSNPSDLTDLMDRKNYLVLIG
ncbi:MAG: glycine cleavage system protein GcvH [Chlamydiae bacterium]|nr:glycine cleavage system protein GcvH [Chlamydiota bacterium]